MDYPNLLITCSGEQITSKEEWEKFRRPEICRLFSDFVYGNLPSDEKTKLDYRMVKEVTEQEYTYKVIEASSAGFQFQFHIYLPRNLTGKIPAVLYFMLANQKIEDLPLGNILKRGYAFCYFQVTEIAEDSLNSFETGVFKILNSYTPYDWGTLSAWGWGASRVMDYLVNMEELDQDKISVAGFSRGGKAVLWAYACDRRFALCLGNNSGCTGASLSRNKRSDSESVGFITREFPYWFAKAYQKYAGEEQFLPVDQHMLLAMAAPRPLYITSASEDIWCDPDGELHSCELAGEVYKLYGLQGLIQEGVLELNTPYQDGSIAYHRRKGKHDLTDFDWNCFLDFADKKLL